MAKKKEWELVGKHKETYVLRNKNTMKLKFSKSKDKVIQLVGEF